jgi:serine protease Do
MRSKLKKNLFFVFLYIAVGVIFGILFTARFDLNNSLEAESPKEQRAPVERFPAAKSLEESFMQIAEEVGPAIVSISTVQTRRVGVSRDFFGDPFGDEFFDRFFRDFFGDEPEREYKQRGLGSGIIIDSQGYILTNEHVVSEADDITVTLPGGREFEGKVLGTDPRSDLAVIKIEAEDLPVARLGDSDKMRIGQWAIAIGNPFGFYLRSPQPTLTVGIISALHRQLPVSPHRDRLYTDLIQTDAAINPGNSGGPLVNLDGEVIGINVAIITATGGYQGMGFAIPVNTAKLKLESLKAGEEIEYGWLGITIQNLTKALADFFKLETQKGVLVAEIHEDSPADKAGLKEGDIINKYDGEEVKDVRELINMVSNTPVGKEVKIDILRNNKPHSLMAEVGKRPDDIREFARKTTGRWRGITVRNITPDIASELGISEEKGVIVSEVEKDSLASLAGIRQGIVIYSINKEPVDSIDEFNQITEKIKEDEPALIRTSQGYIIIKE